MNVLVDTSVWSPLLRRKESARLSASQKTVVEELKELVEEDRAFLCGIVRQELLTGIRSRKAFNQFRDRLCFYDDLLVDSETHELAAEIANQCLDKGVMARTVDLLICATAKQHEMSLFTMDKGFGRIQKHVEFELHEPRQR